MLEAIGSIGLHVCATEGSDLIGILADRSRKQGSTETQNDTGNLPKLTNMA
jgi:hypothetical protein